jgi:activator of 2-hydroxyglutaryl-CoA dehydratase
MSLVETVSNKMHDKIDVKKSQSDFIIWNGGVAKNTVICTDRPVMCRQISAMNIDMDAYVIFELV